MQDFEGKVAVVTGSAGGIGRGLAERFIAQGMRVVLADIDADRLAATEAELRAAGATVLGVPTDVTDIASVQALAKRAVDEFGAVHVLCNNAGVNSSPNDACWEVPIENWEFVLGVNLRGVIHGIHAFLPIMLAQASEGHIVSTASAAGLGSRPGIAPYVITKAAVISLSESLHHDLQQRGSKLRASVLCPGRVQTQMTMNQPGQPKRERTSEEAAAAEGYMTPHQVGDLVVESIREERFYIYTHPESTKERVRGRADDMIEQRLPTHSSPIY